MELTGILLEDQNASCSSKLNSQSIALQKIFCDTKYNRQLRGGGEKKKSNNSENQRLSQLTGAQ